MWNSQNKGYKIGINQFSDLLDEEIKRNFLNLFRTLQY
jgi:hypothetical protein